MLNWWTHYPPLASFASSFFYAFLWQGWHLLVEFCFCFFCLFQFWTQSPWFIYLFHVCLFLATLEKIMNLGYLGKFPLPVDSVCRMTEWQTEWLPSSNRKHSWNTDAARCCKIMIMQVLSYHQVLLHICKSYILRYNPNLQYYDCLSLLSWCLKTKF